MKYSNKMKSESLSQSRLEEENEYTSKFSKLKSPQPIKTVSNSAKILKSFLFIFKSDN